MFSTPPRSVLTRRERLVLEKEGVSNLCGNETQETTATTSKQRSQPHKMDIKPLNTNLEVDDLSKVQIPQSKKSSKSSSTMKARQKQLELEAAEAKAKVQMELIDERLKIQLAFEDGSENQSKSSTSRAESLTEEQIRSNVESWLDNKQDKPASPQQLPKSTVFNHTIQPGPSHAMHHGGSCTTERLLSRLATPRELPSFGGDSVEWLHFKSAYEESTKVCQFSDSENLWRLRKALRGDARDAVTDLLIGNTPPAEVMEALELRFGRAEAIVQKIAMQLRKLQPLPSFYQTDLFNFAVKVNNSVATIKALNQCDYLRSPELVSAVTSKLPNTLIGKWAEFAYKRLSVNEPKLEILAFFLKKEAEIISAVGVTPHQTSEPKKPLDNNFKRPSDDNKYRSKSIFTTKGEEKLDKCKFCQQSSHLLTDCRVFRRAMRKDRWSFVKTQRLCYCCLNARHDCSACPAPVCDIDKCGLAHHRLLHWKKPTNASPPPAGAGGSNSRQKPVQPATGSGEGAGTGAGTSAGTGTGTDSGDADATVAHFASNSDVTSSSTDDVMLKVIPVQLSGPNGIVNTYALLDDAASVSIIDTELVSSLGLKCQSSTPIKFIDAFGLAVYQSAAPLVHTQISGQYDNKLYDIKLRKANLKLPVQNLSVINHLNFDYLSQIKPGVCKERVSPRLLIGQDNYYLIAPLEMIHGSRNAPYATRCRLGWSIHGYCGRARSHDAHVSKGIFHLSQLDVDNIDNTCDFSKLNDLIKHSFDFDSIGISTVRRENTAHLRALQILDDTSRHIGSGWEVGIPFKSDAFTMPNSYEYALSRQNSLLRKFEKDSSYATRYSAEINKLLNQGYARELTELECSAEHDRVWYLPHFGVQTPNKPGKLRLVFDAAAKVKGHCLNDYLLTGPDLYNSLMGIMFRFRENPVAITGDIKDMFLRIKIRSEDRNVMRFLWHDNPSHSTPPKVFAMQSLIFGATSSPFIAQYIKNKNALKFENEYPESVNVIVNDHYMDDCVHSTQTVTKAVKLVAEITEIHKHGGFHIRGWSSNCKQVLDTIPADDLAQTAIHFKNGTHQDTHVQRTLGLLWNPIDDSFGFQLSLERIPESILSGNERPTKAKMLSIIMSVYDIHGFLSPFMIKSKTLLQNVHRSGVDWQCKIQEEDHTNWVKWLDELKLIESLRIPRWYGGAGAWTACSDILSPPQRASYESPHPITDSSDNGSTVIDTQMHIFCDASIKAYAAVIYWRFIRSDGFVNVCFVASKSRVTKLTPVSVPRLELQGALLGARLADTVQKEHKDVKPSKRYFWTDSSTVLQWIRSDPRTFKSYVAFRLGEIDELTAVTEWRHVPSRLNVADVGTKDDTPPLKFCDVWFQGPDFLRHPEDSWPKDIKLTKSTEEATCELRSVNVLTSQTVESCTPNEDNISSWLRLVRATAMVLLFVRRCQRKHLYLNVELMEEAESLLIKKCQHDSFSAEITCIANNNSLKPNSRLSRLTPYLDEKGILRAGGRIDKTAGIDLSTARPVILDGQHQITRLLVEFHHRRAFHGANELVVNELRQKYWVLNLRPTVRTIAARCLFCRHRRAMPKPQRMADLPSARLQHNRRPFFFCGVDFFGPMEVTVGRRRQRRYGMLFTCLTIRAVHIELTENLTTDSAIMALRRMSARRGLPSVIYSDNGTNLRGADTEIKRSIKELNTDKLREDGSVRGIEWRFIPPGAPEMGGAWERMIRTVKTALKVTLKERAPHPETLSTLMAEVEAVVNSRPITHVSTDPNYPEALTPNHFLIGTSSTGPQFGKFENLELRKQWRTAQRLADMFWLRWIKEYLPTLLPRQKWTREERALQVGDYVIVAEPNLERGSWRHGVVSATHAGRDRRVRIVDIRTRTGLLRRPVTRVALLTPVDGSAD